MSSRNIRIVCALAFSAIMAAADPLWASPSEDIAVVCSKPVASYIRTKLPDGTFRPEYYAFGKGGSFVGALHDSAVAKMDFSDVARTLALSLSVQNYFPSKDPGKTNLLILVYWGVTDVPPRGAGTPALRILRQAELSMAHAIAGNTNLDDYEDGIIAALPMISVERGSDTPDDFNVGAFLSANNKDAEGQDYWPGLSDHEHYIIAQAEAPRYFVALMAYDFQQLWTRHRHQLEWATSFSVRQDNHDFAKDLPRVAELASKFFGQDSNGLLRRGLPQGSVEIGTIQSLGEAPLK